MADYFYSQATLVWLATIPELRDSMIPRTLLDMTRRLLIAIANEENQ